MQVNVVVFARLNPSFWHSARHIWVSPSPDITFSFDVAPESLGYGVPQGSYLGPTRFAIEKFTGSKCLCTEQGKLCHPDIF